MNVFSLDDWLDRAVAPGYSALGYRLRGLSAETAVAGRLDGRVALVTGASSGIGEATCLGLARAGAAVHMLCRNQERGDEARRRVLARLPTDAASQAECIVQLCDLSDLSAVRSFAERFARSVPQLHVLVNNAGVLPEARERSRDGIELTFATNVVAPFALTRWLLEPLAADGDARVVTVSSGGMYTAKLRADDLQSTQGDFDGTQAYARSKRAEVILTELAAQRCGAGGVAFYSMHPGWVDTAGIRAALPRFHRLLGPSLRDGDGGADTIVWLATSGDAPQPTGTFWHDRRVRPTHRVPWTHESGADREQLWSACLELSDPQ